MSAIGNVIFFDEVVKLCFAVIFIFEGNVLFFVIPIDCLARTLFVNIGLLLTMIIFHMLARRKQITRFSLLYRLSHYFIIVFHLR